MRSKHRVRSTMSLIRPFQTESTSDQTKIRPFSKLLCDHHPCQTQTIVQMVLRSKSLLMWLLCARNHLWSVSIALEIVITMQRYTEIVTGRYARFMYLVFVSTMLIHRKLSNIAENSYFSRNRQIEREISNPCSQKCPNPSREIQVQTL